MNKTILVADDDKTFHRIISRVFEGSSWQVETAEDGVAALESISSRPPDVILLDLNMPRLGGRELLTRIRGNPRLAMIPVIIISGDGEPQEQALGFGLGADDFISKPFDPLDLVSRVESASRRNRRMLSANPLTFLPGGPAIEEDAKRRIKEGGPLAFFYIDIDNFKAYNDNYGYLNGDNAIKGVAGLLLNMENNFVAEDIFVGHIGGDDFVVMANPRKAEELARAIAAGFDALAPGFYSEADRARGFIVSKDRSGETREFPLMTLTIAIATNEKRALDHYAKIVDAAGEIKKYLKGLKNRAGSIYLKDRRGE
ncbi:MAG: response regulator [Elusimicrobiota bacterium]|nr:response regulator [Elusimicrobiota bacterium]